MIPRCINRFRFDLSYPLSKLLKFFKLLSQCLDAETQSERTIIRLSDATHDSPLNYQISALQQNAHPCAANVAESVIIVDSKKLFRVGITLESGTGCSPSLWALIYPSHGLDDPSGDPNGRRERLRAVS